MTVRITFEYGSLLLEQHSTQVLDYLEKVSYDQRVDQYRAQASDYASIRRSLFQLESEVNDEVFACTKFSYGFHSSFPMRDYQEEAIFAWENQARQGTVILPTGVGKSFVAANAIARSGVPALVVVPTIDLMLQWNRQLEALFNVPVGMLGGGKRDFRLITVSTYDSALIHMEYAGNQFPLIIFDEAHHLPGPTSRQAAEMSPAPYRLALTATPDRTDGEESFLYENIGPIAYRKEIDEFEGETLSDYETVRLVLELTPDEELEYHRLREIYTDFLKKHQIHFGVQNAWQRFLICCGTDVEGPKAMKAYLGQKKLANGGRAKKQQLWLILQNHKDEKVIIFTGFNDLAYEIGNLFGLPVITHQTKAAERKSMLEGFRSGIFPFIVTSRVLNEGIDVPDASVGVIMSGTGSVREHVQRLGRILRPSEDKRAILYELVSKNTSEYYTSERRRQHRAYK
ncbi:MAG: DEAD/DEAH box helicase family protein [Lentisphaeria bacterium]|nr:DEAD/DEAH box helicase family protein [Lentisphaeria bacterium]